jgi:hypothetical protein
MDFSQGFTSTQVFAGEEAFGSLDVKMETNLVIHPLVTEPVKAVRTCYFILSLNSADYVLNCSLNIVECGKISINAIEEGSSFMNVPGFNSPYYCRIIDQVSYFCTKEML